MLNPPLIAVTAAEYPQEGKDALIGVPRAYIEALLSAGASPLIVPAQSIAAHPSPEKFVDSLMTGVSGILLPGGDDIDPRHYGESPHPQLGRLEPQRDLLELALVRWAYQRNLPVLGICRGIQVMNVALGGTLYQDIPSELPEALTHQRGETVAEKRSVQHTIAIQKSSQLGTLLLSDKLGVNSTHHQAVKTLGNELKAIAHSADGLVEALEAPGKEFFIGVQCHPELLWTGAVPEWRALFQAFVTKSAQRLKP